MVREKQPAEISSVAATRTARPRGSGGEKWLKRTGSCLDKYAGPIMSARHLPRGFILLSANVKRNDRRARLSCRVRAFGGASDAMRVYDMHLEAALML